MRSDTFIPPDRLMQAVDAIYAGYEELGGVVQWPPSSLMGSGHQPASFCDFTRLEIHEAERFLLRSGLVEFPKDGRGLL